LQRVRCMPHLMNVCPYSGQSYQAALEQTSGELDIALTRNAHLQEDVVRQRDVRFRQRQSSRPL
jgi:hypothetical protein